MSGWNLRFLTEADRALLSSAAQLRIYAAGDVIVREGERHGELSLIRAGFVRVTREREGRQITIAQLGPGALFGEMSLLENQGASASVVAGEAVEVAVVGEPQLRGLMGSDPGFTARFYHSLGVELAGRLRATSQRVLDLTLPAGRDRHAPRTGMVSERQIPLGLVNALGRIRAELVGAEAALRERRLDAAAADAAVRSACDALQQLLAEYTREEQLVDIGWSDLLAFRDVEQVETGVGAYVFRETFSLWMNSTVMARCYTRPSGTPDDLETWEAILQGTPAGDGYLGPLIDAWFLHRPFCTGRRAAARWLAGRMHARLPQPGAEPLHVTALGLGAGMVVLDLLRTAPAGSVNATFIDADQRALLSLGDRLEAQGLRRYANLVCAGTRELAAGEVPFRQRPQQFVAVLGLIDSLPEDAARGVLAWAESQVAPGGELCWTCPASPHPDRELLLHLLEWELLARSPEALTALAAGGSRHELDETGSVFMVTSTRSR